MTKISYRKYFGTDGTVYHQRVRISKDTYQAINNAIENEIENGFINNKFYCQSCGDNYVQFYLKPVESKDSIETCNLTTKNFIAYYLNLNLKDMNTYLVID